MELKKLHYLCLAAFLVLMALPQGEATGHCFCHRNYCGRIKVGAQYCTRDYTPVTGNDGTGFCFCQCCPKDTPYANNWLCGHKTHEDDN